MPHSDSPAAEQFWRRRARLLAAKLNFHHGLARLIPVLFGVAVAGALFDLLRRELGLAAMWTGLLLGAGGVMAAGWAWFRARGHFCSGREALVRLETVLGLHNRLSVASEGVLPWPAPVADSDDGYQANWKPIVVPLLAGAIFLWAAHLVPVSKSHYHAGAAPISAPPEFAQVQSWINALKAEDLIEPEKLQEMQAALDKLRDRPAQDWYTQGNLEAANSLKELAEQSMNSLAQDLDHADQAVEAMQDKEATSSEASSLQPMQDQLRAAGENLASGNLPLKRELVNQMTGADSDKALTQEQLAKLHNQLQKGKAAARTAPKSGGGMSDEMEMAMAMAGEGHGHRRGTRPGPGGRGGGEQTAPLELQDREKTTPEGARTPVASDDMSHVSLGDTVKVSAGAHKVDPNAYRGVEPTGAAQIGGTGGESVWRSTYDPQEADVLSRFFK